MSEIVAEGVTSAARSRLGAVGVSRGAPDVRRLLQLGLAGIWLLDRLLQYQSFMFTKGFSQMLAGTASGNPGVVASPINWDATLVGHHPVLLNTIFATIQLLLGDRDRVAADGTAGVGRLGRLVAERVVVRRGTRGRTERGREPAQRRSRCGDRLRAARGAAMAGRPRRPGALHRGTCGGRPRSPGRCGWCSG